MSGPAGVARLAAAGPFDHLVIATSAGGRASSIPGTAPAEARAAFGRFWTAYDLLHAAGDLVRRGGSVTLISGSSGRRPGAGFGFWSTLHGSIEALARAATLELAPTRINVVSPGGIGLRPDRQLAEHAGSPDDIGAAALALIANPAITNAVLDVDGGERLGRWSGSPVTVAA
ncbi:SDR family oxidoreductase [Roseomonas sp. CCTCC AB2023176]|uniref:SDR family oxidoreductase n=1 Tax=Roseomonas sp. CCTCC AB2023176 TaxID=3342640 RepID=UPI0035E11DD1